jgi:hypothetical protein
MCTTIEALDIVNIFNRDSTAVATNFMTMPYASFTSLLAGIVNGHLITLRAHQATRSVEGDPGFAWEASTNTSLEISRRHGRIATLLLCDAASAHKLEPM